MVKIVNLFHISVILKEITHVTNTILRREAFDIARKRRPGEEDDTAAFARLQHIGGDDWLTNIKKRFPCLRTIQKYRPSELERAIKNQPEFTLNFWRLLMHTYALMHIHRVLASGMRVEGWCFNKHNYVTREDGSGNGPGLMFLV
jgi:hypothetical protein